MLRGGGQGSTVVIQAGFKHTDPGTACRPRPAHAPPRPRHVQARRASLWERLEHYGTGKEEPGRRMMT